MICVYPANCTDFSTNGNGTIEPTSALVTETLNGVYELQLVHPIDDYLLFTISVTPCINILPENSMSRSSGIFFPSSTHWR